MKSGETEGVTGVSKTDHEISTGKILNHKLCLRLVGRSLSSSLTPHLIHDCHSVLPSLHLLPTGSGTGREPDRGGTQGGGRDGKGV